MRLAAEFPSPEAIVRAAKEAREHELACVDAFTPYPVPKLDSHLGIPRSKVSRDALIGGIVGLVFAYVLQWWCTAIDFPLDVGGRPLHSAPAFIPIAFETTVLFASACAFGGVIVRSGLPRLWTPMSEVDGFDSASVDGHWLVVDTDASFESARDALQSLGAQRVELVGGA